MTAQNGTYEELQAENERLLQCIAELKQEHIALQNALTEAHTNLAVFTQTLDYLSDMVLIKGPQSRIMYGNKAFRDLYGMSQEELQGMIDAPFNEPDYTLQYIKDDEHVFTTGQLLDIPDEPVTRHDGVVRRFHTVKAPIYDEQGHVIRTVGISQDITNRVQKELDIRQSQVLLQNVIDNIPGIIYVKDFQERYLLLNTYAARLMNRDKDQIIGKTVDEFFPEDTVREWQVRDQHVRSTGEILRAEDVFQEPSETSTYQTIVFPLSDEQGTIYATGGISLDITERKRVERDLNIFKTLVENAPDAIAVSDLDEMIVYANPVFRERTGYGEQVFGSRISDLYHESAERIDQIIQHIMEQGFWRGENSYRSPDGQIMPNLASVFVIPDDAGTPCFMASIESDLRQQRQAEAERAALQQQVIDAQQAAIRELSTPLIPIADDVVIMPIIGTIDSMRAQQVLETLLEGVAAHQAACAILDITGVQVVDTQVANALIRAAQAVKLLGAQVVLTGIRPEVAQTLVHLGVELSGIVTCSTLQAGIAFTLGW